jgi:hypothetical protein
VTVDAEIRNAWVNEAFRRFERAAYPVYPDGQEGLDAWLAKGSDRLKPILRIFHISKGQSFDYRAMKDRHRTWVVKIGRHQPKDLLNLIHHSAGTSAAVLNYERFSAIGEAISSVVSDTLGRQSVARQLFQVTVEET